MQKESSETSLDRALKANLVDTVNLIFIGISSAIYKSCDNSVAVERLVVSCGHTSCVSLGCDSALVVLDIAIEVLDTSLVAYP